LVTQNAIAPRPARIEDRNLTRTFLNALTGSIAPHVFTGRGTYTTPTARNALIEWLWATMSRDTAAGTPGTFNVAFLDLNAVNALYNESTSNAPGTVIQFGYHVDISLKAGQQMQIGDTDPSTGGTCSFIETLGINEFD
jgi:hypothetical protein